MFFIPLESFQIADTQGELAFPFGAKNCGQKKGLGVKSII
jgi:hypothetical protein